MLTNHNTAWFTGEEWGDLVTVASTAILVVFLACACILLVIFCPPLERRLYGKEGYRVRMSRLNNTGIAEEQLFGNDE